MYNGLQSGNISPLRLKTQPIIPLVYSDALSYMEMVAKLTQKVNEVIENMNTIEVDILSDANSYTDNKVKEALSDVSKTVNDIISLKEELERNYTEFTKLTNAHLVLLGDRIDSTNKRIDETIVAVNEYTNLAIDQNNSYILSNLSQYLSQVKVINFFTGESVSVQGMIDYLAMLHVDNSLSYELLIDKSISYNTLIGNNMTYTQMVLHGNELV